MKIKKILLSILLSFIFCFIASSDVFGYMIPMKVNISDSGTTANLKITVDADDYLQNVARVYNNGGDTSSLYYQYLDYDISKLDKTPSVLTGADRTNLSEKKAKVVYGRYGGNGKNDEVYKHSLLQTRFLTYASDFTMRFSTEPTTSYKDTKKDPYNIEVKYYEFDENGKSTDKVFTKYITEQVSKNSNDQYFYSKRLNRDNIRGPYGSLVDEYYTLDSDVLEKINNKLNDGYEEIYCSYSLHLLFDKSNIVQGQDFYDRQGYKYIEGIDTLGKWFHVINNEEYGDKYDLIKKDGPMTAKDPNGSIVNEYDNILRLPEVVSDPVKVMVRHILKTTSGDQVVINGNPNETLISNNSAQSIINTGYSSIKRKNVKNKNGSGFYTINGANFSEYYEISKSQGIKIDRLRNFVQNDKQYNLKNYKVKTSNKEITNIDSEMKNVSGTNKSNYYTFKQPSNGDKKEYVYIDFYYEENKIDPPGDPDSPGDPPSGRIDTDIQGHKGEDEGNECATVTVPAGESLKPYVKTSTYVLKDLRYDLKEVTDADGKKTVEYKLGNCSVYKLTSGSLANDSSRADIGTVIGSDRWTVFEGNSNLTLDLSDGGINKINNDINKNLGNVNKQLNKLPTDSDVDKIIKGSATNTDDFKSEYKVPENRYNGLRKPYMEANYSVYDVVSGTNKSEIKNYPSNRELYINIFTPLHIGFDTEIDRNTIVDHRIDSTSNAFVIQKNAKFTIKPNVSSVSYPRVGGIDTKKYLKNYVILLNFDVQITQDTLDNMSEPYRRYSVGEIISAGSPIEIGLGDKFVAIANSDPNSGTLVNQDSNFVKVIGVITNMPSDSFKESALHDAYVTTSNSTEYVDYREIQGTAYNCEETFDANNSKYKDGDHKMYYDAKYFAMDNKKSVNVGRIYDFKITDCSDIDYKSVFRKNNSGVVNELTGTEYFSGIKRFNIYTNEVNTLEDRENIGIAGAASKKIIPLGPYKSTNTTYVNAPKLGYRISFDLKTSGFYDYTTSTAQGSGRIIQIKPSYYYISKKGDIYNENIDLYYKNSSGKYIKFNGSDYSIYFKPNDGYRFKSNQQYTSNISVMSSQLEELKIGGNEGFTLNYKMMSGSDNKFIQSWYGEFKLPNSTIAVKDGNISKPLTDGYIGVKFDIVCSDSNGIKVSYNSNNKNAENQTNTTQWDYEGFLGFNNPGHEVTDNITLQLEKGVWSIDNNTYNKIKGTVVLYDIDNRAANDFE